MNINTKTKSLLAITFAAVMSLSLAYIGSIPQVTAFKHDFNWDDYDWTKPLRFGNSADFETKNCIITGFAKNNLSLEALAALDCKMKAWLDNKGKALKYKIMITGMELVDSDGNTQDDVNQLHIHKQTGGTAENPTGPHQLNVFRAPNFDDSDVVVKPVQGIITGIWDDGDENLSFGEPDNSHKLSENLQLLCDGKIFSAAHGNAEDDMVTHHKAPYLKMLLDPTKSGEKICKKLGF
jgi:hypothetical protein